MATVEQLLIPPKDPNADPWPPKKKKTTATKGKKDAGSTKKTKQPSTIKARAYEDVYGEDPPLPLRPLWRVYNATLAPDRKERRKEYEERLRQLKDEQQRQAMEDLRAWATATAWKKNSRRSIVRRKRRLSRSQ